MSERSPDVATDEELLELDDVDWQVDQDGTEYFVHDGLRFELGPDGYAYEVGPADEGASIDATVALPRVHGRTAVPPVTRTALQEPQPPVDPVTRTALQEPQPPVVPDTPASATGGGGDGGALLQLRGLRSGYGNLPVLHGVDLEVARGETAVLLGLNGAGKTTTAMNVCGALDVWEGSIAFDGQDVTRWSTKRCVDAGIVMVPEGRRVFPELSVGRNLQVGSWSQRRDAGWVDQQREQVLDYFPRLRERLDQLAGTLSGGEQQMLAIARGLMARPKLLIIDEASMGLAPVIVKDVFDIVRRINADGVTVLLIEQNVGALEVADLGVVMEQGRIVRTLRGAELTDRSAVSEALMG